MHANLRTPGKAVPYPSIGGIQFRHSAGIIRSECVSGKRFDFRAPLNHRKAIGRIEADRPCISIERAFPLEFIPRWE